MTIEKNIKTVGELKKELENYPEDFQIFLWNYEECCEEAIKEIFINSQKKIIIL